VLASSRTAETIEPEVIGRHGAAGAVALAEGPDPEVPVGPEAGVMAIMATTRAMRYLAPDPVPNELIRTIVEAATWAPSASNDQGAAFVVVTERETLARLAALWRRVVADFRTLGEAALPERAADPARSRMRASVEYQRAHFADTPALIVVCYDQRPARQHARSPLRVVAALARRIGIRRTASALRAFPTLARRSEAASIYPAVENLLLAARAHGLGACLTTWHLLAEAEFKAVLGIPKDVETFAVIPVGWPLRKFGAVKRRAVDEVIHRERW
jgi:nitroreductase